MADLGLVRVDYRLIHGQVIAKWLKQIQADKIIVINDNLAKDSFMQKVYKMAVPPSVTVQIIDLSTALSKWKENNMGEGKILLLFKDVETAVKAWEGGITYSTLQVGGLGGGPGRKPIYKNVSLSDNDFNLLNKLSNQDVNIIFQAIPEEKPMEFKKITAKM